MSRLQLRGTVRAGPLLLCNPPASRRRCVHSGDTNHRQKSHRLDPRPRYLPAVFLGLRPETDSSRIGTCRRSGQIVAKWQGALKKPSLRQGSRSTHRHGNVGLATYWCTATRSNRGAIMTRWCVLRNIRQFKLADCKLKWRANIIWQ